MAHIRSLFFTGPLEDIGEKTLAALEDGRPSEIIWNITNRCNLLCKHCYLAATQARLPRELDHEEAMRLVDEIGEAGVPLLFLTGGEPFMREDLWEIIGRARSHGIRVVMSTNATLIGPTEVLRLRELEVDFVAVSVYGPEDFHDEYVKVRGTWRKVMEAVRLMREAGIKVGVKSTVNQDTVRYFEGLVQVTKDCGAGLMYPCDQISAGRAEALHERSITAAQWRELADLMLDDVLRNEDSIEYDIGAMPSIAPYLNERLKEMGLYSEKAEKRLAIMSACPVGKGLMGINAEGVVKPCSFMEGYSVGNVKELGVRGAAERLFEIGRCEIKGACGECEYSEMCRGCRAKANMASGDLLGEDPSCMLERPVRRLETSTTYK